MDISQLTPKAKAELLTKRLLRGKEVAEAFDTIFESRFKISGQPPAHWRQRFMLHVPVDNITPQICRELDAQIMELHGEATFFFAEATARAHLGESASAGVYYEEFKKLLDQHEEAGRKRPAAQTLEAVSRVAVEDLDNAVKFAHAEAKFWKSILDHLGTCRRLIENATMTLSSEMKAEANAAMIERLAERANHDR